MNVGDIVKGRIISKESFGVFVEFDNNKALLHEIDLSWSSLKRKDLLSSFDVGENIEARIININEDKISLSIREPKTKEELIERFKNKFSIGDRVKLKILSKKDYGIFFEVIDGIEGFLHVSEYSKNEYRELEIGTEIEVVFLNFNMLENLRVELGRGN